MYEADFRPAVAVATPRRWDFWRRQFGEQATPAQRRFDIAFGIILPVLCFVFDPIVFRDWHVENFGVYERWQSYTYTVCTSEMVALAAWLLRARGAGRPPAVLGGVLFAGGLFSLLIGVAILPFSLLGLIVLVGVFGFTPFPTALVYLRNGWRAAALGRPGDDVSLRDAVEFALGFVFALGAPALMRLWILFDF
ncbi:MAG TPA: hypothetical protein VF588_18395 [Pyrinomonadaceae bacterium]|jgi:hypothetical protein